MPDGTLRDASLTTTTTEPASDPAAATPTNADSEGPPETYNFAAPDGAALDTKAIESATPIFKELGLSQSQAQKLVDFYNAQTKANADQLNSTIAQVREAWRDEVAADPDIGNKIPEVKVEIGRALDKLGDAKLVKSFRETMDSTGIGDNPALIKTLFRFAKLVNEGSHVTGGGPSEEGQTRPGTPKPTAAQAMYPTLPSAAR